MSTATCYEAFCKGAAERASYPLRNGEYKLRECADHLARIRAEIVEIQRHRKHKRLHLYPPRLVEGDAPFLKDVPREVSRRLAYEVLPGLLAMVHDGADVAHVRCAHSTILYLCMGLLGRLEGVRETIERSVRVEYVRMRAGGSSLIPLVDEAIKIAELALTVLDGPHPGCPGTMGSTRKKLDVLGRASRRDT